MECVSRSRNGNADLMTSVRHMGNAFLNRIETSQEEAACLVLQLSITRMSGQILYLHTAHQDERRFIIKR